MLTMIGKRLMFAIPSLIGVVIVTFLLTRALPGDPAAYFAGPAATKEAVEQIRKKLGLDKQKLFDIASKSSGSCWSMVNYCPVPGPVPASPANRDYQAGFTAAMMLKDLRLAQEAAQAAGAGTPMSAEAAAIYERYCGQGESGRDFSGIIRLLRGA